MRASAPQPFAGSGLFGFPTAIESGGNSYLLEQLLGVYHEHGILVAVAASSWLFDMSHHRPLSDKVRLGRSKRNPLCSSRCPDQNNR